MAEPTAGAPAQRPWRRAALRVAVAAALLGALLWFAEPLQVWRVLRDGDPAWLVAGLASAVAANLASAWRWRSLAAWFGRRVPLDWAVAVYFRAIAVNALLPGAVVAGDMYRAVSLARSGCGKAEAAASVVLDRVSGLWILFAIAAAALALGGGAELPRLRALLGWPDGWPLAPAAWGGLLAVLALPLAALALLRHWGGGAVALLRRAGGLREYGRQAAGSLAVQLLSVGALACAAQACGVALPLWLVAASALPIFLFATLPIGFGGWGTREAAAVAAWGAFGVPAAAAFGAAATYGVYALLQALGSAALAPRALAAEPADPA